METMEQRIQNLEAWRVGADRKYDLLESKLDDNTAVTKEIKAILTSGKMGVGLIKWLVSVGAGIAVILGLWHSK